MIIAESIREWVRSHSQEETLMLMTSEEIWFEEEGLSTNDSAVATILTVGYMFLEVERERRSILQHELYMRRVKLGKYTPRAYFGYEPFTFQPSEEKRCVVEMFQEAADGVEASEIAEWLNDCGLHTVRGNPFTSRSVRAILSNPIYCGDVVFHRAGKTIRDHHEGQVSRNLWERVNGEETSLEKTA